MTHISQRNDWVLKRDRPGDVNAWYEVMPKQAPEPERPLVELAEAAYRMVYGNLGYTPRNVNALKEAIARDPQMRNFLRDSLKYHAFYGANNFPAKADYFVRRDTSMRPEEYYLNDGTYGVLPRVPAGGENPEVTTTERDRVRIDNHRYAMVQRITEEDMMFDRLGQVARKFQELGTAAMRTIEDEVFKVLTNTSNYTMTEADNDGEGSNHSALALNAENFIKAYVTLSTVKDSTGPGVHAYLTPDTFWCTPKVAFAAQQLFLSDSVARVGGASTNEVYGTGGKNVFGIISQIIVSPLAGTDYQWGLFDSTNKRLELQMVKPINVEYESPSMTSESYIRFNSIRTLVSTYFGVGFSDNRPYYYSNATTAPSVS